LDVVDVGPADGQFFADGPTRTLNWSGNRY
jgi:hypothetical protein